MAETIFSVITVLGVCIASLAQDTDYYKAIQRRSSTRVHPAQFKQMEENGRVAHSIRKNLLGGLPFRFWFWKGWATLPIEDLTPGVAPGGWPIRFRRR